MIDGSPPSRYIPLPRHGEGNPMKYVGTVFGVLLVCAIFAFCAGSVSMMFPKAPWALSFFSGCGGLGFAYLMTKVG